MENIIIPLVNWGMGALLIGVFAVVCIALVLVIYSLASNDKKAADTTNDEVEEL